MRRNISWHLVSPQLSKYDPKTGKGRGGISDDDDLTMILSKLKDESYSPLKALKIYIEQRLLLRIVAIDEPLKAVIRLSEIRDTDIYVPGDLASACGRKTINNITDINKTLKQVDDYIGRTIILAEDRQLSLTSLFAHEFTTAQLSLCDKDSFDLLNQQKKSSAIDYLKEQSPSSFSMTCPIKTDRCALGIDGGSLLEIKPTVPSVYLNDRIDIVFDTAGSKKENAFIKRHGTGSEINNYDLKSDDVLETKYHRFLHNNRATLAERIREIWCEPAVVQLLLEDKILVAAGPRETAVTLKKNLSPQLDHKLYSNHVEADTRIMLHVNVLAIDEFKRVIIQASDTDVVLLSIGHGKSTGLESLVVKSFNTMKKTDTYINSTRTADEIRRKFKIEPFVLLILHALSGSVISFKKHRANIVSNLPPTSDAFYHHCLRASQQINIWKQVSEQDMVIPSMNSNNGCTAVNEQSKIQWASLAPTPSEPGLLTCEKYTTNCQRAQFKQSEDDEFNSSRNDDDYAPSTQTDNEEEDLINTIRDIEQNVSVSERLDHSYCKSNTEEEEDEQQCDDGKRCKYDTLNIKKQHKTQQQSFTSILMPLSVTTNIDKKPEDSVFKHLLPTPHRRCYKKYDFFADDSDSN
ncbi:unnamed protein product [Didymodactylos carnosus]|uniref:Uncharacterized protein n=1 Tax=Didymodactylos carnosus TaxID=1234261 RepID=A0A8S2DFX9_9BILA|nr:unnamed protein product [Didymodactylos carnosus]CAF3676952.1 unnamed protein product [Didymodactylos carnosus]